MLSSGEARMSGRQLALEETYDCCRSAGLSHQEAMQIARTVLADMTGAREGVTERRMVGLAIERAQAMLARRRDIDARTFC